MLTYFENNKCRGQHCGTVGAAATCDKQEQQFKSHALCFGQFPANTPGTAAQDGPQNGMLGC